MFICRKVDITKLTVCGVFHGISLVSCLYAFMVIKPDVGIRQQVLITERAFRAAHAESGEAAHSVRLTQVEFRAVGHVTGEAGCALCHVVAQIDV